MDERLDIVLGSYATSTVHDISDICYMSDDGADTAIGKIAVICNSCYMTICSPMDVIFADGCGICGCVFCGDCIETNYDYETKTCFRCEPENDWARCMEEIRARRTDDTVPSLRTLALIAAKNNEQRMAMADYLYHVT